MFRATFPHLAQATLVEECGLHYGLYLSLLRLNRGRGERVYSQRRLKDCAKSSRQRRRVPLPHRVVAALRALPRRLDTPLLFPAARGVYIDGETFGYREWTPALRAA